MNFAPKAVGPVLLVASRPNARLPLLGRPKLISPPVVWSPSVAPNLADNALHPYQPDNAGIPKPPLPLALTGKANPKGLDKELVRPFMTTGLAAFTEVAPGLGSELKSCK